MLEPLEEEFSRSLADYNILSRAQDILALAEEGGQELAITCDMVHRNVSNGDLHTGSGTWPDW